MPVRLTEFEMLCVAFAEYIKNKKIEYTLGEMGLFEEKMQFERCFRRQIFMS